MPTQKVILEILRIFIFSKNFCKTLFTTIQSPSKLFLERTNFLSLQRVTLSIFRSKKTNLSYRNINYLQIL